MRDKNALLALILILVGTVAAWAADQNYHTQRGRLAGIAGQVVAWGLLGILYSYGLVPPSQLLVIGYLWVGAVIATGIRLITKR